LTSLEIVLTCIRQLTSEPMYLEELQKADADTELGMLGLDSLAAVELVALIEIEAEIQMPAEAFDMPDTVGALVHHLDAVRERLCAS
jgi:acyl carrier protein